MVPECNDDVGDGPADDEGDGAVEGHLGDVGHARRQPDVGQRNLEQEAKLEWLSTKPAAKGFTNFQSIALRSDAAGKKYKAKVQK